MHEMSNPVSEKTIISFSSAELAQRMVDAK